MTPGPLMFVLALSAFQAQQGRDSARFYSGPVRLTHVRGVIELADGADPTIRFDITARNTTAKPDSARVAFRGGTASRLALNARDSALLSPAPRVRRSGKAGGAQGVTIDLAPEVNDLPLADAIDSIDLRIVLPAGGASLLRSSLPAERDSSGGRTSYHIALQRRHLTTLNLVYTTGPVSLILNKTISPAAIDHAGPVTVTLTVRNTGRGDARGVLLEDSYDPRDFAGQGTEFRSDAGKVNDRRLVWSRQLDQLAAGATTTVTYTLSALFPVQYTSLAPATASIGGELVGVSNKIWLPGKR